jgi:hypothetical protein
MIEAVSACKKLWACGYHQTRDEDLPYVTSVRNTLLDTNTRKLINDAVLDWAG